MITYL